jgi:hypothetical protein
MAKKKELPKAMMGTVIKPVVRAVVATGRVAGKSTVRGAKAFNKSATYTTVKDFLKGSDIKAAGKGFARGVKSQTKIELAKAAERRATAQKTKEAAKPKISEEQSLMNDLNSQKNKTQNKQTTSSKKPMSPEKKKRIKQAAVVGTIAAAGAIKYANRDRRRLND